MAKGGIPISRQISDLELIVISNENHAERQQELEQAHKFLSTKYGHNKVVDLDTIKFQLADSSNDFYRWLVKKNEKGNIEAVVVVDSWNVPKEVSDVKIDPDGKNQYTPLFYATANKGKELLLKQMVESAQKMALMYSSGKDKNNIGIVTEDIRHLDVLKGLGAKYIGKMGVPPLDIPDDVSVEDYSKLNFATDRVNGRKQYEKLVVIPSDGAKAWPIDLVKKVVLSYLDEGYNTLNGKPGYKPLTTSEFYQEFVKSIDAKYGKQGMVPLKPITFKK